MDDLLYSRPGNFKNGYGLEVTSESNIYYELLYHQKNHDDMSCYRVNVTKCRPEDILRYSVPALVFIRLYNIEER